MNINPNATPTNKEKYPYVNDSLLFRRVQQYIETFEDPERIDTDSMVEDLRLKFKEYGRRQKSAFKGMVKRAYRIIMESRDENNSASENSKSEVEIDNIDDNDEEDGPVEVGLEAQNVSVTSSPYLNSIQKIFMKQNGSASEMQELININSNKDEKNSNDNGRSQIPTNLKRRKRSHVMAQFTKLPNVKVTPVEINKRPSPADAYTPDPNKPKIKGTIIAPIPSVTFDSFGGFPKVLQDISELVIHIKEVDIYTELGVTPPRGFLLHGPPGCGKTLLAQAVAGELKVPLVRVSGPELVAGVSGESESRIRELFDSAVARAPCILFIDEIDAISPPRDVARREMERRIVAQLLTCIDGLSEVEGGSKVIIIGATNRPDALDPALRRAGRFDREVCLGIPDRTARKQILQVLTSGIKLSPDINLDILAAASPGFVGADLKALMSEAAIAAVNRVLIQQKENIRLTHCSTNGEINISPESTSTLDRNSEIVEAPMVIDDNNVTTSCNKKSDKVDDFSCLLKCSGTLLTHEQLKNLFIEMDDFTKAFKSVQPSAKREGFATVPDVTWDDIGSLKDVRSELQKSIMMPVKYVTEFEKLGITAPSGILLCGPPGCGKTLLAKAVANEANINFISVKGPELLNMYVGESERAVRQCFQRAKNSQPCVIFFDEIDALCPRRSASSEGHNTRVVNQVLTEMDGIEGRKGVFLMAATNRPDMVDLAVLRPGRLDKILYVGLPSAEDRIDILKALTKNGTKPLLKDVDLQQFGRDPLLDGYTGADLAALVKEASVIALTEYINHNDTGDLHVSTNMLKLAAQNIRPSVSVKVSYKSFFCCSSLIQIYH
ncbi:unnamed protein product [Nezara viridula]|uniref:AAA+ ATPase domain-containing protein n=1 Tax=Nezara viridula TaxID=85310 RepID=A0A9P0GZC8_NEZVI|nr:unnamed protein product [Nezara viridula]